MSARDIIKQAFESEFDDACSGDAFADKCVTILHEEGFTVLAPGELDGETLEAAAKVADEHAAGAGLVSHEFSSARLEELPDAIRALKASPLGDYTEAAIASARQGAIDRLLGHSDGYPRSWDQEARNEKRRGYRLYEKDIEAPPIAGYESLAADGYALYLGEIVHDGQKRKHFRITERGRRALKASPAETDGGQ